MNDKKDNRPSHRAYQVIKISKDKAKWREIGAGWLHSDMTGLTIKLDSMPVDGEIVMRSIDWDADKDEAPDDATQHAAE